MIATFTAGIELMGKGGVLMYPIFLASVIAGAIIIERLIFFKKCKEDPEEIFKAIKDLAESDKKIGFNDLKKSKEGPVSRILEVGLKAHKDPRWKLEEKLTVHGQEEIRDLRKNLRGLEVIATISPLMGLLGTVIGMVKAFNKVAQYKGQVDPSLLYFERKVESISFLLGKYGQYLIHQLYEEQGESSSDYNSKGAQPELTDQRVRV
jgi:biopolymer transport protein ExbB